MKTSAKRSVHTLTDLNILKRHENVRGASSKPGRCRHRDVWFTGVASGVRPSSASASASASASSALSNAGKNLSDECFCNSQYMTYGAASPDHFFFSLIESIGAEIRGF